MSREMCLQTVSSTVKLKWNVEFLMPECFFFFCQLYLCVATGSRADNQHEREALPAPTKPKHTTLQDPQSQVTAHTHHLQLLLIDSIDSMMSADDEVAVSHIKTSRVLIISSVCVTPGEKCVVPQFWGVCPLTVTVSTRRRRTEPRTTTQKTLQAIPPPTAAMERRTQVLSRYKLNEVFIEWIGRLVVTTCCLFGCNHLRWRVTFICLYSWPFSFCGGQLFIETIHRSNKYYFIFLSFWLLRSFIQQVAPMKGRTGSWQRLVLKLKLECK